MAEHLYGIIDCASDAAIYSALGRTIRYDCLYAGPIDAVLAKAAPYLVEFEEGDAFWRFWRGEGRGRNWGIMCISNMEFNEVRRHFRHFLQAQLPDNRVVEFRFYDPRVFRVYLPTCKRGGAGDVVQGG